MDDPDPDLRATPDERESPPDFDALTPPAELVRGERTRDDFLDAVLSLDGPATVEDVADRAGHGTDAAREYLQWFERMGIVTQTTESPATYERNREYLRWRRVHRLRQRFDTDDLLDALRAAIEDDDAYADAFGVDSPTDVSISAHAAASDRSIEDVWADLSTWKTTRRRIVVLERALAGGSGGSPVERTAV